MLLPVPGRRLQSPAARSWRLPPSPTHTQSSAISHDLGQCHPRPILTESLSSSFLLCVCVCTSALCIVSTGLWFPTATSALATHPLIHHHQRPRQLHCVCAQIQIAPFPSFFARPGLLSRDAFLLVGIRHSFPTESSLSFSLSHPHTLSPSELLGLPDAHNHHNLTQPPTTSARRTTKSLVLSPDRVSPLSSRTPSTSVSNAHA